MEIVSKYSVSCFLTNHSISSVSPIFLISPLSESNSEYSHYLSTFLSTSPQYEFTISVNPHFPQYSASPASQSPLSQPPSPSSQAPYSNLKPFITPTLTPTTASSTPLSTPAIPSSSAWYRNWEGFYLVIIHRGICTVLPWVIFRSEWLLWVLWSFRLRTACCRRICVRRRFRRGRGLELLCRLRGFLLFLLRLRRLPCHFQYLKPIYFLLLQNPGQTKLALNS